MTASLLEKQDERRSVVFFSSGDDGFKPKLTWSKSSTGKPVLQVADVPVFRSGTFRDSMGIQHTWEALHMNQMIENFEMLANRGTFRSVPVRKGHGSFFGDPMDSLIGWHTGLAVKEMQSPTDGGTYTYLLASYELFDETAQQRVENGNWPNRSSEIGTFVSNSETEYWPAYMGFAFVDIPAVEGLNFSKYTSEANRAFSILVDNPKEFGVPDAPAVPVLPVTPAAPAAPAAAPVEPAAPAAHAAPVAPAFEFTMGGVKTTDFAAVQRQLAVYEEFERETQTTGRANFITSLAEGNAPRIAASQIEALTAHAQGLSAEQFESFKKVYEGMPATPGLAVHGASSNSGANTGAPAGTTPVSPNAEELATKREIVARHKMGGMSEENIKKTSSYQRMVELEAAEASAAK